ncbi:hypothetical protein ES703_19450 [subsurface metagenome]
MNNQIGKIKRVGLREVWKHEALGLTTWLENNIDVISEAIDLELSNAEREKPVGDFNVDLTAEDKNGNLVVIENQLEKSDHEHLGKLLTYLSSLGAKTAIWIVARPRAEHVNAVSWMNESGLANFYLLKIEAIKIEGSPPAPLLTLITGPSEESRKVGEVKKNVSERQTLRLKWWTQLLKKAKVKSNLHANISPCENNWLGTGAGISGLNYNYSALQHSTGIELYIDTGEKDENERIFDKLYQGKNAVETVFGEELQWQKLETKKACIIARYYEDGGYRDNENKWPDLQDKMINRMILFHKAISPFIKEWRLQKGGTG